MGTSARRMLTFLMTDVVGSTRLWESRADDMREALRRHDLHASRCVEMYRGRVIKPRGEGDSIFAVFDEALDAVLAVAAFTQALRADGELELPLAVRAAVHTGEAYPDEDDWYGPTINRLARLRAA